MPGNVKVGGIWKEFNPRVKVAGTWKDAQSGWVKVGGVWKQWYTALNPFTGIVNWLIGADSGKLFASQDGTTFAQIDTPVFGTSSVNDVFYGPDLSSLGNNTFLAAGDSGKLAKSSDGLSWTSINIGGTNNYQNIAFGNNTYYAGGS